VRALAVDWSGAWSPGAQRRAIWVAEAVDGVLRSLAGGFTRDEAVDEVLRRSGPGVVVGLDFSFSFPRWFAEELGARSGPEVWRAAVAHGEAWLTACAPPFWGRPGRPCPTPDPARPGWRRTESGPLRPKSTFQVGGAGSVGTGSVRGMPHLLHLRHAGAAIWPFDPPEPNRPVVAEVYPRWATGPVPKRRADARAAHIARLGAAVPRRWVAPAASGEDAFDAACTAVALSGGAWRWPETDAVDRVEGRILPVAVPPPGHTASGAASGSASVSASGSTSSSASG
jgi:hypothetical protein